MNRHGKTAEEILYLQWQIINLRIRLGMTYSEVAKALHLTRGQVAGYCYRARAKGTFSLASPVYNRFRDKPLLEVRVNDNRGTDDRALR